MKLPTTEASTDSTIHLAFRDRPYTRARFRTYSAWQEWLSGQNPTQPHSAPRQLHTTPPDPTKAHEMRAFLAVGRQDCNATDICRRQHAHAADAVVYLPTRPNDDGVATLTGDIAQAFRNAYGL